MLFITNDKFLLKVDPFWTQTEPKVSPNWTQSGPRLNPYFHAIMLLWFLKNETIPFNLKSQFRHIG
nr:MAG TPA: hypothetical protein [Caudoviricetes sp.]